MTWAEIKIALKILPEIIVLIKLLVKKVSDGMDAIQLKATIQKFDSALNKSVESKDTTDLEDIFRGKGT